MPYLTLELDDVDYAKLRELSQAKRMPLRNYTADVVTVVINDPKRLLDVQHGMNFQRMRQRLLQPPAIDALIGHVHELVGEVAPVDFDATSWVVNWLKRPLPALGGRKPGEYLHSQVGFELLTILIGGMIPVAFWTEPAIFDSAVRPDNTRLDMLDGEGADAAVNDKRAPRSH